MSSAAISTVMGVISFETLTEWVSASGFQLPSYALRALAIVFVLVVSFAANFVAKKFILRAIRRFISRTRSRWDDLFVEAGVFTRLSHVAPALVVYSSAELVAHDAAAVDFVKRLSLAYMVVIGCLVIDAFLTALVGIYRTFESSQQRPVKAFVQVAKIFVYIVTIVLVISQLTDKDPWSFLTSLGALTAIVLLVFKDSILGLVAGVQLSAYDMVRRGDWIEMPKYGADGDVIDITLNTVKVQNWNKTISTIPTHALVTDSFKNWRGMSESGGRRIKRSVYIDINTVKLVDTPLAERFRKFDLIREYVDRKEKEIAAYNKENGVDDSVLLNGRRVTNIGTFRRYVEAYLRQHPNIHKSMTLIVRQLQPTNHGLPIEVYCFSNDQVWANYEALQADIFDHIFAVIPHFDLRAFQDPSGHDFQNALAFTADGREGGAT
jgi:miniconductance mechanosensitive channel